MGTPTADATNLSQGWRKARKSRTGEPPKQKRGKTRYAAKSNKRNRRA